MRYFVIGEDGQKYGPADIATLQTWIDEGRLLPTQQLEEETSGMRAAARAIPGLRFPQESVVAGPKTANVPQGSPYSSAPQGSSYQQGYTRPGAQQTGDDGQSDVVLGWVFGALGLLFCCLLDIPAFIFANRAITKGNPGGSAVRIFCFVVVGLQVVGVLAYFVLVGVAAKNGVLPGQRGFVPTR